MLSANYKLKKFAILILTHQCERYYTKINLEIIAKNHHDEQAYGKFDLFRFCIIIINLGHTSE